MIRAVREVQLCEIDSEASDPADPECNPQRLAPEVARHENRQENVDEQEQDFVIARREIRSR